MDEGAGPSPSSSTSIKRLRHGWPLIIFGVAVIVVAAFALGRLTASVNDGPGASSSPSDAAGALFESPTIPTEVQGIDVISVSNVLRGRSDGALKNGPYAVGGYWSSLNLPHSCVPPNGPVGDLQVRCHDGEFGITELNEQIMTADAQFQITEAIGPHLTPYIRNEVVGAQALFSLLPVNGQPYPPVPIVVIGHFDDRRADECGPDQRQLCLDRLVVDAIAFFDPEGVELPAVTPTPTPFPTGLAGLFGPEMCGGAVVYSFVGWTTTQELHMAFDRPGHVWAMVTAGPVDLGGVGVNWNDDPNGSSHRFRVMGRRICIAEEGQEGTMEFDYVPGSEFVLWDDGLVVRGLNFDR